MSDQPPFRAVDPLVALALLSRIPMPLRHARIWDRTAAASWAFPLIGAALAALVWLCMIGAERLGLPAALCALVGVGAHLALTGMLHEDGLADCADGFFGGAERAGRLEIMKDSRLGAYGAGALFLALGARWSLYQTLTHAPLALIAAGALSRGVFGAAMRWAPQARPEGLAGRAGRPPALSALGGLLLCAGFALPLGAAAGGAMLAAVCGVVAALALAQRKIGGVTGDVLGAAQVSAELAALSYLAAAFDS